MSACEDEAANAGAPALPLHPESPGFQAMLDAIAQGAAERDRERIHRHEPLARIRAARVGALRIPPQEGGLGISSRALFDVVIRLGEADSNVAHVLRNHFASSSASS